MTEQEILDIVKKAGYPLTVYEGKPYVPPMLEILLETAAAAEREACAKEADKRLYDYTMLTSNPPQNGAAWSIANAIRARGEA